MYNIQLTKQAQKVALKVECAGLKPKAAEIIKTIRNNPYEESQDFAFLKYDLKGAYSRRITRQPRFVHEVLPNTKGLKDAGGKIYKGIIKVISMWTHYHE
jgi:Uncharacterized protein conserved in bacteria